MGGRDSDRKDLDSKLAGGLRHSPFARLRADRAGSPEVAPPASFVAPEPPVAPAPPTPSERLVVRRERKGRGGKGVTLVEGPGLRGADLDELARSAARALGTGARVENGALVVQGEGIERVSAWLATRGFDSVVRGN